MKPLYDATTVMLTLRDGINKGYWTLEDLDVPPPGYIGTPENFRNLLRDDFHPEAVQAAPDPRDFAEPGSNLRSDHAPLPVEGRVSPMVSDGDNELRHEPDSGSSDSEGQAELGTEGEHPASSSGMPLDW